MSEIRADGSMRHFKSFQRGSEYNMWHGAAMRRVSRRHKKEEIAKYAKVAKAAGIRAE